MKAIRFFFALMVLTMAASVAMAQDGPGGGGHRGRGPGGFGGPGMGNPIEMMQNRLKKLDLSDDQKTKIDGIIKEYEPKVKEAHEANENILTAPQKKALADAIKAAKDSGDWKSVRDAVQLTDEQKTKRQEAMKTMSTTLKELHDKVGAELTDEQKEKLAKMRGYGDRGGSNHRHGGHHGDHNGSKGDSDNGGDSKGGDKPNEA